ncbi:MAG TPA: class I SAM-dependent methyltransferase [Sphingopyxis sp.]|nr:class I SAM-dependent methyltransferase [Sphingopyxis sp.]
MTSRETTHFLARPDICDALPRPVRERLEVIAFGAIQWPWLLRSLRGGRKTEKAALLHRLDLAGDALPHLGSWKADTRFLTHIVDAIERLRPAVVVELGCGASSLVIAKALSMFGGGRLVSYDQHQEFVIATARWLVSQGMSADLRHAPLGPPPGDWPGLWYQLADLPADIGLLVIDGPPWALHPLVRGAAEALFPRLAEGAAILLDDAARPGERLVARRWQKRWPQIDFAFDRSGTKGTLIGHVPGG